ncbi:MAG TPA: DUF309 domain-containing protein [Thermoanaerobaculia bacterium]|nr:DUF309 domain-containing protein [Thermoanaerobaculia bacterium]
MAEKPPFAPAFLRGVEHFNALEFWEAHEAWEELWLVAGTDVEQFLQGLIQVAAAYHHIKRGTYRGAVRLIDAGLARLTAFPERFCGLDRSHVESAARQHQASAAAGRGIAAGEYPKLEIVDPGAVPHHSDW